MRYISRYDGCDMREAPGLLMFPTWKVHLSCFQPSKRSTSTPAGYSIGKIWLTFDLTSGFQCLAVRHKDLLLANFGIMDAKEWRWNQVLVQSQRECFKKNASLNLYRHFLRKKKAWRCFTVCAGVSETECVEAGRQDKRRRGERSLAAGYFHAMLPTCCKSCGSARSLELSQPAAGEVWRGCSPRGSAASSFTNHRWLWKGYGMKRSPSSNRSVNPCQSDWLFFFFLWQENEGREKKELPNYPRARYTNKSN